MRSAVAALGLLAVLVTWRVTGDAVGAPSLEDAASLEAFFDGAVPAFLEAEDAPGMTISVVKDGRLLLAKGYGLATRETGEPVVADRTLFRIGSVSKIFLATALMQLVEQGRIDLDTDLNEYLEGVEIPATYPEPITLRHVMTHTTGFEDSLRDVFVPRAEFRPLREALALYLPRRVRPPGELISYSNHATALAGLVVEQVSGEPYDDYIERHILEPLGMAHTTTRQPLPASLSAHVSTATDMARFMIMHLQLGRFEDVRILEEATARRMQSQLFTQNPRANGLAHQFFEYELGSMRLIGHGGGMVTHITMMGLLPERGVGFFASINAPSRAPVDLQTLFVERYFPAAVATRPVPSRCPARQGAWRASRAGTANRARACTTSRSWDASSPRSARRPARTAGSSSSTSSGSRPSRRSSASSTAPASSSSKRTRAAA